MLEIFASWFGLVRLTSQGLCTLLPHVLTFLIAPTIQSHEIWNLMAKVGSGKDRGFTICQGRWTKAVVRVDTNVHARPISVRP